MYIALMQLKRLMARVKEKRENIDMRAESIKTTIRNSKLLLVAYQHTIARKFSKKEVNIASVDT